METTRINGNEKIHFWFSDEEEDGFLWMGPIFLQLIVEEADQASSRENHSVTVVHSFPFRAEITSADAIVTSCETDHLGPVDSDTATHYDPG